MSKNEAATRIEDSFSNYIRPCDILLRLIAGTMVYIRKEMLDTGCPTKRMLN